ncbi:hypothetical protein JAAARDRAFT_194857 [Jaapia argillacea MUCL 33604]|uniref:Uncharacterized protein n=1 Tax=Jaapia argillacea MUCL 33604 TaxID=933084 RepID=A0A067PQ27_9AGAM|nr:hypothetical protein JAAARDRAFT_194857 [Jaapia argillacea MUCL 33604]
MLSVIDAIYLYNRITPAAHFFIGPRYTRNKHGDLVDRADIIEREHGLVTNHLHKAGYLQASLWTLQSDPTQIEALTVIMHRPTTSDLLEEAEGVVYYPIPVVTIRYDPSKDLQADAAILPPLTRLRLSELLMVEPIRIRIDSDTDVASSASYHPDSLTSSLHESDYQPVSPLLSALGDSSFTSTTDLDLEERHPQPFSRHPSASPADAPNPRVPTPHPFALAVSAPTTPASEWPSLPTPPNEPTTVNAWGSGWTQEQVDEWNQTDNRGWNEEAIIDSESVQKDQPSNTPLPPLHWSTPSIPYADRLRTENHLFDFLMERISESATTLQTAEWSHSYWVEQGKRLAGSDGLMGPQLPSWHPSEPAPVAPKT